MARISRALELDNKHASNSCGLDSSTGRVADRYPENASSNPARVSIFQLTLAVSDYNEKLIQGYVVLRDYIGLHNYTKLHTHFLIPLVDINSMTKVLSSMAP